MLWKKRHQWSGVKGEGVDGKGVGVGDKWKTKGKRVCVCVWGGDDGGLKKDL